LHRSELQQLRGNRAGWGKCNDLPRYRPRKQHALSLSGARVQRLRQLGLLEYCGG